MNYYIKEGYIENIDNEGNVTQKYTSVPLDKIYQLSVYKYAKKLSVKNNLNSVIEFGSGSGYKLNKYFSSFGKGASGIDYPHARDYCFKKYPGIDWISEDFDNPRDFEIGKKFDLILSIDVIEHLVKPKNLLDSIKKVVHENSIIILSTPERDLVRGVNHFGPPENKKHVREWNAVEFKKYIENSGFDIIDHQLLEAYKPSLRQRFYHFRKGINNNTCQVITCKVSK